MSNRLVIKKWLSDPDGPAIEPPAGTSPNFDLQDRHHTLGEFVIIFCSILSTLAVVIRLTSRYQIRKFHIDDVCLIAGLAVYAGYAYTIYACAIWPGSNIHNWDIQLKDMNRILWLIHLGSCTYGISIMFVKLAILLDWMRIFIPLGQRNKLYWMFQSLIWGNVIFYVSGTFLEIFRCSPRQKIWDPLFEGGICPINIAANNFSSTLINLASDIAILLLPQWIIWRLHMSKAKRIGLSLLFVIGIFATAAGLARLVYLLQLLDSEDEYYWIGNVALWGAGELTAGFLVIGVPGVPKVIQSIQASESFTNLLSRFGISAVRTEQEPKNARPTERNMGRISTRRKPRGQWDISDTDTFGLVSIQANPPSGTVLYNPGTSHNGISRENRWDVYVEVQAPQRMV